MDFAKKILSKYGWKDGEGLGKNNDGISKPLKATLKFDNAGFGADQAAEDFNNHWWERVFNEAANNVDIMQDDGQIKMTLKDDKDGVEISTKSYSMKKLKNAKRSRKVEKGYDNFLQAATLTIQGDEIENSDKIDTGDIEVTKVTSLTDEELFKACGGRTAHKGARHGLKLSGKLLRIQQQEEELLAKIMEKRKTDLVSGAALKAAQKEEKDKGCIELVKKKKHKNKETILDECETEKCKYSQAEDIKSSIKKKKRKHFKEETAEENPDSIEYKELTKITKLKKKRKV